MKQSIATVAAVVLIASGCASAGEDKTSEPLSTDQAESVAGRAPNADSRVQAVAGAGRGAGYAHAFTSSRFRVGATPKQTFEYGMAKQVGEEGVFATLASGMILAIPNATAPSRHRPPLTTDPAAHNSAARDYFISAGLPADQIGGIAPYATMHATEDANGPTRPQLSYYTSVLERRVKGIHVEGSIAYVHFNVDGDAVEEGVYWPAIPDSVIEQAIVLQHRLAEPAPRAALLASIPGAPRDAEVVIHHPSGMWRGAHTAVATVDVQSGTPRGADHFDGNGARIFLPHEDGEPSQK